jgi:hypothetical protein
MARFKLSLDWWALVLAGAFFLAVKTGLISTVPW